MKNDHFIKLLIKDPDYQIFPNGRILTRKAKTGKIFVDPNKTRPLSIREKNGSLRIKYMNHCISLARVIYAAWVGDLDPNMLVYCVDGNFRNVEAHNLALISRSESNRRRFEKHPPVIGNSVLTWADVRRIRQLKKINGLSHKEIGKMYGISKGHVSEVVNNKIWREDVHNMR